MIMILYYYCRIVPLRGSFGLFKTVDYDENRATTNCEGEPTQYRSTVIGQDIHRNQEASQYATPAPSKRSSGQV